jgi:ribosomal protein S18 acetylase RimI-like enzyme
MTAGQQPPFRLEPLASHDRAAFSCGVPELDTYLREQAGQDKRRGVAVPYVLVDRDTETIAGYMTLSMAAIQLTDLPPEIAHRLPRYGAIPTVLIGRLAVATAYQGRGVGQLLLVGALDHAERAARTVAAFSIIVDAKNDAARAFYERFGFARLEPDSYRLYLRMADVLQFLRRLGLRDT